MTKRFTLGFLRNKGYSEEYIKYIQENQELRPLGWHSMLRRTLKRRYGLSDVKHIEEVSMVFMRFINTENKCQCCGNSSPSNQDGRDSFSIDHCHEMASNGIFKLRGFLCHGCNIMEGYYNPEYHNWPQMDKYLKRKPLIEINYLTVVTE